MEIIDVKAVMEEVSRLEKIQAQVELRSNQIQDQEKQLVEKLEAMGLRPQDLDTKIAQLEASISEKLTHIRSLDGSDPTAI